MKISILSMQRVDNFGSLLQGYSLMKILKELSGGTVDFIDIKSNKMDNALLDGQVNDFNYENEKKLNGLFEKIKKIDRYTINRLLMRRSNKKQCEMYELFRKEVLKIKDENNNKDYDLCVIGSDEVFNCLSGADWGFTSQLFGNVENAKNVITYAASCGATKYENVPEKVLNRIADSFKKVLAFSVRDQNTFDFVSKLSDKKISINLDPVLIGDFEKEINNNEYQKCKLPKKYCIVYSYYNRINQKNEIKEIKKFCKENDMKIISIGAPQWWIKKHIVVNPFQMLSIFKNAEFVITDTFHGTIFAAKYSKKFATIVRESNRNKLMDLLVRLNKKEHLINKIQDLEKTYEFTNNIDDTNKIISECKEISTEYLKSAIDSIS